MKTRRLDTPIAGRPICSDTESIVIARPAPAPGGSCTDSGEASAAVNEAWLSARGATVTG